MEVVTGEKSIEEELLSDRRLTLKEISVRLEIPKTTVIRIIHEDLHTKKSQCKMGDQTSFFNSEGAPFDVLSEDFGALSWQTEARIGINCHRG